MIDVLKRLAELDSDNPNVIKENQQVEECGMMPEMGMGMPVPTPQHPASINMTAGSGEELGDLLTTIMSLAGVAKQGGEEDPMGGEPVPQTLEPIGGAPTGTDAMRSVIDKLNPMDGDDQGSEQGDEQGGKQGDDLGPFQGDTGEDDKEEVDEYDNTPSDPNDKNEFDADEFAHQENQPGQGDRMDGDRPKAYADMNEAVKDLFAQYKSFIGEAENNDDDDDEDYDDSGPKDHYNPNSKPHPKGHLNKLLRKKLGEPEVKEGINESLDILKLAGLK